MKIAFVMIVFQSDYVLRQALDAVRQFGPVFVCEGPVKYFWRQGIMTSTDHTNDVLREMLPSENVVHGQWSEKDQMMNAAASRIPEDVSHVWMVDADEVYRPEDIEQVLVKLDQYDSVAFKPTTFFGGFDHVLTGFEERFTWYRIQRWYAGARWATHRPPTVNSPEDGKPWREHRHWDAPFRFAHYSYVFPSAVKAKIDYYGSRNHIIPNWFINVYLPWVRGDAAARQAIEDHYDGVHEWMPESRGDCRTVLFDGEHPAAIQAVMPKLKRRFDRELEKYSQ